MEQTEPLEHPESLERLDLTEPRAQTGQPVLQALQVQQVLMALLGLKVQQVLRGLQAIKALQVPATKAVKA